MSEPDVSTIIEVLERDGALELVDQPRVDQDEFEIQEVSWGSLFPPKPRDRDMETRDDRNHWSDDEFGNLRKKILNPENTPENFEPISTQGEGSHWDVAAWYQPIHYYGHDWGIYIKEKYLIQQAIKIAAFLPPAAKLGYALTGRSLINDLIRASFACYFLHEHYHHKAESLGLRLHVSHKTSHYLPYQKDVYRKSYMTDDCLEEALANANAYQRLRDKPYFNGLGKDLVIATQAYLKADFPFCPPGYRKATDYLKVEDFREAQYKLCAQMLDGTYPAKSASSDWALATNMTRSLFNLRANIYTIVPKGARTILPTNVSPITCTPQRMEKLAEAEGYRKVKGGKGSHIKMTKPNSPLVVIPTSRKDLATGTRKSLMKTLKISDKDLSKN
jgi:predicted RNA binding protein YcfA (HicA-like mRNA interferase family)